MTDIVWLKRDLRTQDHAALAAAEQSGRPYRIIYIFEPLLIDHPDTSDRHLQFNYQALLEMNRSLAVYQRQVDILQGEATAVFEFLIKHCAVKNVWSYQESGLQQTWDRDKALAALFKDKGITWHEFQRDGIVRGSQNRDGWDARWYQVMHQKPIKNTFSKGTLSTLASPFAVTPAFESMLQKYSDNFQPAGEHYAWRYLESFTRDRGHRYHLLISKPTQSRLSCARLSPYLAWGCLSVRQAYQHIRYHQNYDHHRRAFDGVLSRLKWHCHFIQKFEVECAYATRCINRGYESLQHRSDPALLLAWKQGRTGFPLIDACMRCVKATGWLNFRMRAMLVSFLCHHLDQDWRLGVSHLAQYFLDYEPGIHYPQFQMQAGTTGINTVRIYNPIKQSQDHDPEGLFIKKWLPELTNLPTEFVHEPWLLGGIDEALYNFKLGEDYPKPIIEYQAAAAAARDKIWGHRKTPEVLAERERILRVHTR